jgi:hypothetical protein
MPMQTCRTSDVPQLHLLIVTYVTAYPAEYVIIRRGQTYISTAFICDSSEFWAQHQNVTKNNEADFGASLITRTLPALLTALPGQSEPRFYPSAWEYYDSGFKKKCLGPRTEFLMQLWD